MPVVHSQFSLSVRGMFFPAVCPIPAAGRRSRPGTELSVLGLDRALRGMFAGCIHRVTGYYMPCGHAYCFVLCNRVNILCRCIAQRMWRYMLPFLSSVSVVKYVFSFVCVYYIFREYKWGVLSLNVWVRNALGCMKRIKCIFYCGVAYVYKMYLLLCVLYIMNYLSGQLNTKTEFKNVCCKV